MAQVLGQPRMLRQLPVLSVNRHEIARPHQIQHQPQFFRSIRARKRAAADSCCRTARPRRACERWSIMRKMVFSLPGIMRELSTTMSPGVIEMFL